MRRCTEPLSYCCTFLNHAMMSASLPGCSVVTLPVAALACAAFRPLMWSADSTLRSVTGSRATPLGSAKRSTMPKGDAANLASGGMAAVAVLSGKLSALRSARPDASLKFLGSSMVNWVCSGSGAAKLMPLTTASSSCAASSSVGLKLSLPLTRRMPCSSFTGTGALKLSVSGRMGRQALCAFSRSQLKLAEKGSRT